MHIAEKGIRIIDKINPIIQKAIDEITILTKCVDKPSSDICLHVESSHVKFDDPSIVYLVKLGSAWDSDIYHWAKVI
jgi:hypothetical protein